MESIAWFANAFIELFKSGATIFAGWVAGIIPLVIVMMTAFNSLIKLIGEDKVNRLAEKSTKYMITRYTILPILAVVFLGNPMCYTLGRFVKEKYKPAFYDTTVSFIHNLFTSDSFFLLLTIVHIAVNPFGNDPANKNDDNTD